MSLIKAQVVEYSDKQKKEYGLRQYCQDKFIELGPRQIKYQRDETFPTYKSAI